MEGTVPLLGSYPGKTGATPAPLPMFFCQENRLQPIGELFHFHLTDIYYKYIYDKVFAENIINGKRKWKNIFVRLVKKNL